MQIQIRVVSSGASQGQGTNDIYLDTDSFYFGARTPHGSTIVFAKTLEEPEQQLTTDETIDALEGKASDGSLINVNVTRVNAADIQANPVGNYILPLERIGIVYEENGLAVVHVQRGNGVAVFNLAETIGNFVTRYNAKGYKDNRLTLAGLAFEQFGQGNTKKMVAFNERYVFKKTYDQPTDRTTVILRDNRVNIHNEFSVEGDFSESDVAGFINCPTGRPTAVLTYTVQADGTTINFDGSNSVNTIPGEDSLDLIYTFDFGDGSTYGPFLGQPTTSHTYTTNGQYTVTLTVRDSAGQVDSTTAVVAIGKKPIAVQGTPVQNGNVYTFDASGSQAFDSDGQVNFYSWTLKTSTGQNILQTPFGAGTASVTVAPELGGTFLNLQIDAIEVYKSYLCTTAPDNLGCGELSFDVELTVRDESGIINENSSVQTISVDPPIAVSGASVVPNAGNNGADINFNNAGSVGDEFSWDFTIFVSGGQVAILQAPKAAPATPVSASQTVGARTFTLSGTTATPILNIDGVGDYTVQYTLYAHRDGYTVSVADSEAFDLDGGSVSCAGVIIPPVSACGGPVEASATGGITNFRWINLHVPPTCAIVTNVAVSGITANTAAVSWNANSDAISYNIRYRATSSGTWQNVTGQTGNAYTLTQLQADTEYEVQVQTVCVGQLESSFTASTTFETDEVVVPPTGGGGAILLGSNFYFDTPRRNIGGSESNTEPMGLMRLYWDQINYTADANGPDNISFNPSDRAGGLNFDEEFRGHVESGSAVIISMQGAAGFFPQPSGAHNDRYIAGDFASNDGNVMATIGYFSKMVEMCEQFAIRYGDASTATHNFTTGSAKLANIRGTKQVNLGYLSGNSYLQPWNENEEWWEGDNYTYTKPSWLGGGTESRSRGDWPPEVAAAMDIAVANAVYAINPGIRVLAGAKVRYDANQWPRYATAFTELNGGQWPPNLYLSIHHYHQEKGSREASYRSLVGHGELPLGPFAKPNVGGLNLYINGYQPYVHDSHLNMTTGANGINGLTVDKILYTEYGYDFDFRTPSSGGSPMTIVPFSGLTKERIGANWTIGMTVVYHREGVVQTTLYNIKDCFGLNGGGNREGVIFCTSGLTLGDGNRTRQENWYIWMLFVQMIQGSNWLETIDIGDPWVHIDRYDKGSKRIYAFTRQGQQDNSTSNFNLQLAADEVAPVLFSPNSSNPNGDSQNLTPNGSNQVSLTAGFDYKYVVVNVV